MSDSKSAMNIAIQLCEKWLAGYSIRFSHLVNVDRSVGERAHGLMRKGLSGLKPPDAIHLAIYSSNFRRRRDAYFRY